MKKICVVTGTRAEYGLLSPLIQRIAADDTLKLQLVATGMHLSPEFGMTVDLIEKDGFQLADKVEILLSSDSAIGISKSMGLANISFAETFERLQPDMVVLLGDRYEIFVAASVATIAKIPVAHLHGGETTEGAYDEAFRHSISKMSWLHFTSTEEYRQRVIQLGESPERVFNVGAIGIENIKEMPLMTKDELEDSLNFKLNEPLSLVTYHPVTLEEQSSEQQFKELLNALEEVEGTIIFTKANSDSDGRIINQLIDEFVNTHSERSIAYTSMGQLRYLSAMNITDIVIGNSSSGIIEAPSFNIPTINIGDRQKGRIQAGTILNCEPSKEKILNAITLALSPEFGNKIKDMSNPYGEGQVSQNILNVIKEALNHDISLKKKFHDLENK